MEKIAYSKFSHSHDADADDDDDVVLNSQFSFSLSFHTHTFISFCSPHKLYSTISARTVLTKLGR